MADRTDISELIVTCSDNVDIKLRILEKPYFSIICGDKGKLSGLYIWVAY